MPEFLALTLREQAFLFVAALILVVVILSAWFAVATMVFRNRNEEKARKWKELEGSWEPLLLEVLAGDTPPEELLARVEPADELFFIDFLQNYVHLVGGDEREMIEELARPFLPRIASRTSFDEAGIRARAIQTLALLGFRDHEEEILKGLDDPSPLVAVVAARQLGEAGGPGHAGALLEHLERYELWTSDYVAEMLASMGSSAVAELEAIFRDRDLRPEVRAIAAQALAQIEEPSTAEAAAEVLAEVTHQEAGVRPLGDDAGGPRTGKKLEVAEHGGLRELLIQSLRLLSRVGRSSHLPLIRPLAETGDPVFRALAITALGDIGETEDVDRLRGALADPSPWVALHAARGLRSMNETEDLERMAAGNQPRSELAREVLGIAAPGAKDRAGIAAADPPLGEPAETGTGGAGAEG